MIENCPQNIQKEWKNVKTPVSDFGPYFQHSSSVENNGYVIPFGDGPGPMFKHRVAKIMIMNMLNQAQDYVYMMSPYLIIDNELCQAIENAAMRGVDVRIITPHIPDKKIVFVMTDKRMKNILLQRFIRALVRVLSPML